MKTLSSLLLALVLCGCPTHVKERAVNAAKAAAHLAAMEQCVHAAEDAIRAGKSDAEVYVAYDLCADEADLKAGKKD
jgi:hypothetical protein